MKKLITISFLLVSFNLSATTYYVRTDGNNANNGLTNSSGGAWATFYYASQHTTSGDVIIGGIGGTYNENTQIPLPIGVSMEGIDTTVIIKSTLTADFTPIIKLASGTQGTNGNQHISGLKFDGQNLATSVAIQILARSNVEVYNCSFRNFNFAAICFSGQQVFFDNQIEPTTYATGNSFHNNRTVNCAGFGNWAGSYYGSAALWVTGQSSMTIYGNYMSQIERADRANGWLIKMTDFTKGVHIYNDTLYKKPYPYATAGDWNGTDQYWDFAIECGDEQGLEINNCIIQGSIDVNRQVKGVYAYSFYFHDNIVGEASLGSGFENGVIMEYGTETARIENNTFKNITEIISFSTRSLSRISNVTIYKNLAYNIGQTGYAGNGGVVHFITDGSNNYIVDSLTINHNTFAANSILTPYYGFSISNAGSAHNLFCTNNIFTNFSISAVGANDATPMDTVIINYNDFYNCTGSIVWNTGTPSHYTNTPNYTANPLFNNIGADDYTLGSGSTLINAGSDGTDIGYTGGVPASPYYDKVIIKRKIRH